MQRPRRDAHESPCDHDSTTAPSITRGMAVGMQQGEHASDMQRGIDSGSLPVKTKCARTSATGVDGGGNSKRTEDIVQWEQIANAAPSEQK